VRMTIARGRRVRPMALVLVAAAISTTCGGAKAPEGSGASPAAGATIEIALVPKAMDSEFWLVLADGARGGGGGPPPPQPANDAPPRAIIIQNNQTIN
jgi:hypothetical protein